MDAEACYHPSMSRFLTIGLFTLTVFGADWPQWRGTDRDGISKETGLLATWPADGPAVVWKTAGLGEGYSSLAIAAGRIFTQGQHGKQEFIAAFDVKTGKKRWETPTSSAGYRNDRGDGPRGTPTVDGDRLYAMTGDGVLVCLETATGKTAWWHNVAKEYGGSVPQWGFSESPLLDSDRIIVMPGGRGASIVSLHKRDGSLEWKSGSDHAGYSSAIVANVAGVKTVLALSAEGAMGVQEDNGELLWHYTKVSNRTANIATPIYSDGSVFLSSAYGTGCALLKLGPRTMSEVYFSGDMKNHYSTSVMVDGYLNGYNESILTAMQFSTGKVVWKNRSVGKGSVTYADKKLYLLGEEGWIGLADATPDAYREISRFNASKGSLPAWSPLVISDGQLYYRDQDGLTAYDIRSK